MKRAIFVRSKTIVMTELDKKIREKEIYRVTLVGSFVNFLLVIFKFLAGIAGHSAAMLADAVHSLSDFITDVVVILFVRISNKPVDKSHDYGHGKYETLATAFIGMALLGVDLEYCGMEQQIYWFSYEVGNFVNRECWHWLLPLFLFC